MSDVLVVPMSARARPAHSFAVNTLRAWHEQGPDVEARLPLLSAYLGHLNPASTCWYLTATPDLLAAAARRLEADTGAAS